MEIIEQAEIFFEKDGDFEFDYTNIITQQCDKLFSGKSPLRLNSKFNLDEMDLIEIPVEKIWPIWDPRLTRAPEQLPPNTYVKTPSLLDYNPATSSKLGNLLLVEARVCQVLMAHPHPNIVKYLGCVVGDGVVKGLCFAKLPMTLTQRLQTEKPLNLDIDHCIAGIESGVHHLHKLGLVHNDINPRNIMMDGDNPVIIDFDSCTREGEELGLKKGTMGWTKEGLDSAHRDTDFYGISRIRELLVKTERK